MEELKSKIQGHLWPCGSPVCCNPCHSTAGHMSQHQRTSCCSTVPVCLECLSWGSAHNNWEIYGCEPIHLFQQEIGAYGGHVAFVACGKGHASGNYFSSCACTGKDKHKYCWVASDPWNTFRFRWRNVMWDETMQAMQMKIKTSLMWKDYFEFEQMNDSLG